MFEWFFKYSAQRFADGSLAFQSGSLAMLFAILLVVCVIVTFGVYKLSQVYASSKVLGISLALRLVALVLLFIPFFEPVLVSPDVVDDENFVAVLLDTSQSMSIPDGASGMTRLAQADQILFDEADGLAADLDEHFQIRYYAFNSQAVRSDSIRGNTATGTGTDLSAALDRVMNDFRGVPLSGIVLLTDGGDNSTSVPLNVATSLAAADAPLYVVGLGQESFETEREILEVDVNKAIEQNTGAEIEVKVRSWASEPAPVSFSITRGTEVVFTEKRMLKGDGRIDQLTFFFEPDQQGAGEYAMHVEAAPNEMNELNNSLELLIDTRSDTTRVLYFEGALRQDFKFVKRALEDDQVIDFVSVSRTGTNKYYRQGIRNPTELEGGFPTTRDELYQFKAVVFGDIEASNFSIDQLRMVEEYVRVRGGGFMMLGGLSSFVEGDYWNTPIADLLPVTLDPSRRFTLPPVFSNESGDPAEDGFRFEPTTAGLDNPILKLSADPRTNRARWATVPGLTSINYLGAPKAGAVVLAEKPEDRFGPSEPLLVTQRYGRGRSTALATASTWRWQMLLEAADQRHERFWRQLIRWQVADAPDNVNVSIGSDHPEPNQELELSVEVFDATFRPTEGARVAAVVRDPFGIERTVEFQEVLARPGSYSATIAPGDEGVYRIDAVATLGDVTLGSQTRSLLVRKTRREFYDASLKRPFLQSLASAAGGAYFDADETSAITDHLRGRRTQSTIYESSSLWDMPALIALIIALLTFEWWYRRRKGLA